MAIKNKIKDKIKDWKDWKDEEPQCTLCKQIDDIGINIDFENGILRFIQNEKIIETSTDNIDSIIETLAEEDD